MNDDINGDEKMQRFEDLGRKLFQVPKPDNDTEEITDDDVTEEAEPED